MRSPVGLPDSASTGRQPEVFRVTGFGKRTTQQAIATSDTAILIYMGLATLLAHVATGGRYGFHRDELATLEDARHLAWGYVAYPPMTPFFGRLSLDLFGTSLAGFRFFAALAQAVVVVLTGLMARELGGRRGAQLLAAIAAIPFCLIAGTLMQYVSFDYLFWVLTAYFVVRLLRSGDARWWVAIGTAVGLGMMAKYAIPFLVGGIVVGLVATDARRYLRTKWLWIGAAIALLIWVPNFAWQARHGFISVDFLRHLHERDIRIGRTKDFLPDQLALTLLGFPLAMMGLWRFLLARAGKRFRMLGWMYVIPMLLFVIARGRGYYSAGLYPMLYAGGSVWGENWLASMRLNGAGILRKSAWAALLLDAALAAVLVLPIAPLGTRWWRIADDVNENFREELGWPELVQTLAKIRDSLTPRERAQMGILAGDYGEAGAINLYGPQYGLPQAISGVNSFWQYGYGDPPPETLIIVGLSREFVERNFVGCRLVAHTWNEYHVENEETQDHPDIFVCGKLRWDWAEFWKKFRYYG